MSEINVFKLVAEAVANAVSSSEKLQLTDASTTQFDVVLEQNEYNIYTERVKAAEEAVNAAADAVAHDPSKQNQAELTKRQTEFQNIETEEQTYTQQADSATQAMQNQTGQDASTLQQKIQLEAAVNQVLQALASALAQHY